MFARVFALTSACTVEFFNKYHSDKIHYDALFVELTFRKNKITC